MSDDLVKRLRDTQEINPIAHLRREAAAALIAKDAENARLRGILAEITMMETGYANATVRRMARRANDAFTSPHKEETP